MALEYNGQRIGAMQYNGVTIGEAMYNGQIVYQSWTPYDWSTTFTGVDLQRTAWTLVTSHTTTADPRQAQIEFTPDWVGLGVGSPTLGMRVLVNGTTVAESHGATFRFPDPISVGATLAAGDVVRFEARGADSTTASARVVDGSASITSIAGSSSRYFAFSSGRSIVVYNQWMQLNTHTVTTAGTAAGYLHVHWESTASSRADTIEVVLNGTVIGTVTHPSNQTPSPQVVPIAEREVAAGDVFEFRAFTTRTGSNPVSWAWSLS